MQRTLVLTAAMAALAASAPARAAVISASFSGTVASQLASGVAVGSPVTGSFTYNSTTNAYTAFTVGGVSYAPSASGVIATAKVDPSQLSAIFQAQNSQVAGAPVNAAWTLDLEGTAAFGTTNAVTVASTLATLALDTDPADSPFNSTFSYNIYGASGTLVRSVVANLTTVSASVSGAVPEPAAIALLATSLLGLGAVRRRG